MTVTVIAAASTQVATRYLGEGRQRHVLPPLRLGHPADVAAHLLGELLLGTADRLADLGEGSHSQESSKESGSAPAIAGVGGSRRADHFDSVDGIADSAICGAERSRMDRFSDLSRHRAVRRDWRGGGRGVNRDWRR